MTITNVAELKTYIKTQSKPHVTDEDVKHIAYMFLASLHTRNLMMGIITHSRENDNRIPLPGDSLFNHLADIFMSGSNPMNDDFGESIIKISLDLCDQSIDELVGIFFGLIMTMPSNDEVVH